MNINPNDPAMPTMEHGYDNTGLPTVRTQCGLTIRAELAARMQAALIAHFGAEYTKDDWHAAEGVKAADALINELNKPPTI